MAVKKKAVTQKTKSETSKSSGSKSSGSKSSGSKSVKSKKVASKRKSTPKSKVTPKSIDSVLGSFEKERVAQNSNLVTTRKKIEQLTKKVAELKAELESLKKEAVETEIAIETLDSRRDKEVGALLSSLGVDLGKAASAAKPKPVVDLGTPLFDDKSKKGE